MYRDLLDRFVLLCRETFAENLTGVYLHGSMAMGCFNPEKSDLDLLVVVKEEPSDECKLAFMQQLLLLNEEAPVKGIEMSIVTEAAVKPFVYPTPFVLHFSPMHLDWFRQDPGGYIANMKGYDPDLAAHCTVLLRRGIVLWGVPVPVVFDVVPKAAYLDSIRQDVAGAAKDILEDPLYITLNLCRVLAYALEGLVLSKQEGGQWGLSHLPEAHRPLIALALDCYASGAAMSAEEHAARDFAKDMLERIGQAAECC